MAKRNHRADVARMTRDALDESAQSRSAAARMYPDKVSAGVQKQMAAVAKREAKRKRQSMKDPSIVKEPLTMHSTRGHVSPLGGQAKRS